MIAAAAFLGIFAMFFGLIMMMNASPPDTGKPGFVVFCCGALLTGAAVVEAIVEALF